MDATAKIVSGLKALLAARGKVVSELEGKMHEKLKEVPLAVGAHIVCLLVKLSFERNHLVPESRLDAARVVARFEEIAGSRTEDE